MFRLARRRPRRRRRAGRAARPPTTTPFPHTKSFGRATIEFQDDTVQTVAIYDYSQRNHDGAWLLVQTGVAVHERGPR